ncbi:MAG: membrane dipeptidase [Steroidobacteraceae bacterium]
MTINRRQFIQASGPALASAASLSWALPALGKAQNVPGLIKDAEELYARSIVIAMMSEERQNAEGLRIIKDSGVTCFSPTLGVRRPEKPDKTYMLQAFPLDAAVHDCAVWHKFIADNASALVLVHTTADIKRAKSEGKAAVMLNFQNSPTEGRLDNIDMFHSLDVLSMQLTYNERNLLGDGSTERTDAGLSDFGVASVERMNELGILVDSAHSGYQTKMDAVKFCKGPAIFSHTNCAALNPHPRNVSDEQIRALADKGGVMGLTTVSCMVSRNPPATMEDYLNHIDHVVKLVGPDHVGFGPDSAMHGWPTDPAKKDETLAFYGPPYFKPSYRFRYPMGTEGLNDQHKWKHVTAGLLKRRYRDNDIMKILGGNWLRVFGAVIG